MDINFTPDEPTESELHVPFIEDARADTAPFYSTSKTEKQARAEIEKNLALLGAAVSRFQSGKFNVNGQERYGYLIGFLWHGASGEIRIAGLPMRKHSEAKERQVRVQALLNVSQWLQTLITQQIFSPGSNPLVPYLLAADGKTVLEHIMSSTLLRLEAPRHDVIDAEVDS